MTKLEVIQSKIIDHKQLDILLSFWKFKDKKIVFTNGCFDILHRGHIEYLSKAADLGDILILGLNTDNSVRKIKGNTRPIQNENSRALILASLYFITNIVFFDEDTPLDLIKKIQPDILVKGADYKKEDIVGADIVLSKGGSIETIDFIDGYSTSNIIEKLKNETHT